MHHITRSTPADIQRLATHPGGFPPMEAMQANLKVTATKWNFFVGLPFLSGVGKDNTYRSDSEKEKIARNWREFDLPAGKLGPQSERHLHGMVARAEHRNASRIPEAVSGVLERTAARIAELEKREASFAGRLGALETRLADDPDELLLQTHATLRAELTAVKKSIAKQKCLRESAQKDVDGDSIQTLRDAANNALAALGGDADRTAYAEARHALIAASAHKFFDAYCTLREHKGDQSRAKGMKTQLPAMARQLELPAKYLEGLEALPIAEEMLGHVAMSPQDLAEAKAAIHDQLVGRRVRDLTAGRSSELPGPPPSKEEAEHWSKEAGKLNALARDYARVERILDDSMPALAQRAEDMQKRFMDDLIEHLPSIGTMRGAMSAAQRGETTEALRTLAGKLGAHDALLKDAPLAGMQLMHVVSMAESVTGHDAERCIALYKALATEPVEHIIGTASAHASAGTRATGTARDLTMMWEMGAHVVPDAVGSLLACNPDNKADWRSVQAFFRCSREHERLAGDPDGGAPHRERMKTAMGTLRDELVDKVQPAEGSAARRDWTMVKSAVWEQGTARRVEEMFGGFQAMAALPATTVEHMHGQLKHKGRGNVLNEAREEFRQVLGKLKDFAQAALDQAKTSKEKENARLLLAMSGYVASHRGTEKAYTKVSRFLTHKEGTFNSGKEIWSKPLKAKEKKAIFDAAGKLAGGAPGSGSGLSVPAMLDHPSLGKLEGGHGALELLREAVEATGGDEDRAAMLAQLKSLEDRVKLAEGGALDGPEAIKRVLHDAIDRTALGDRTDTMDAQQFKLSVPFGGPLAPGVNLFALLGGAHSAGMTVNLQANNEWLQLTMGTMTESAGHAGLAIGTNAELLPNHDQQRIKKTPFGINLPGGGVRGELKQRTDQAVVLKIPIKPKDGLRDLADAQGAMKQAVDLLVDFKPGETVDGSGRPYGSALEMMCDKLASPFTIDDEVRETTSKTLEAAVTGGRVAVVLGSKAEDNARLGFGATAKYVRSSDLMRYRTQQGASEVSETTRNTVKLDAFIGFNTSHTHIKGENKKNKFGFPLRAGGGGGVDLNIGGSDVRDRAPVEPGNMMVFKKEYGNYSGDVGQAVNVLLEALPALASRIQEVVDKGFRKSLEVALTDAALARGPKGPATPRRQELKQELAGLRGEISKLKLELAERQDHLQDNSAQTAARGGGFGAYLEAETAERLAPLEHELGRKEELYSRRAMELAELDLKQATKELVDKELAKMEGEVLMNFGRALMLQRPDRFAVKLESKEQWAHRGIDAAIDFAAKDGDEGMAEVMRHVAARVFAGDKDMAVKYLSTTGDVSVKLSQFDVKNPLYFKRREVRGSTEEAVPDIRTATLNPMAQRLLGERNRQMTVTELQEKIAKTSLALVRSGNGGDRP